MRKMTEDEWRYFLLADARTAKLATVRPDGRPHVAPVWFTLDGDDIVFMTMASSVKGQNLQSNPAAAITVDEEKFPFAFVLIEGSATIYSHSPEELLPWATRIAERYVGKQLAYAYGQRNAAPGEVLIRVALSKVIAWKGVAD